MTPGRGIPSPPQRASVRAGAPGLAALLLPQILPPLMYPFTSLPENLAAFCQVLRRQHGFDIGPGELHDAARALGVVDLTSERAVRHALRPILGGTLDDVTVFDVAFARFFFPTTAGPRQEGRPSRPEPGAHIPTLGA